MTTKTTACFLLVVCSQFSEAYIGTNRYISTPTPKSYSLKQRIPFVPVAEDTTKLEI